MQRRRNETKKIPNGLLPINKWGKRQCQFYMDSQWALHALWKQASDGAIVCGELEKEPGDWKK